MQSYQILPVNIDSIKSIQGFPFKNALNGDNSNIKPEAATISACNTYTVVNVYVNLVVFTRIAGAS